MSRRWRALVPTMYYPPSVGGVERLTREVSAHLGRFDVRVVCPGYPGGAEYDAKETVEVKRIPVNAHRHHRPAVALFNVFAPIAALGFGADIVLSTHVLSAGAAAVSARVGRVPLVQYVHAEEMTRRPGLSRRALAAADAVIAISHHSRDLAMGLGADPERIEIIHPGTHLPDEHPLRTPQPRPPTIVTVSRIEDRFKGHDTMIDAMPEVLESVPEARWLVIGDGPLLPELRRTVEERGLSGHVEFAGQLADAERDRAVAGADVFCMPSRVPPGEAGEGFGIVYLEAGAHGVPVVGGASGGALDAVKDGETGLLVDSTDHRALADALKRLLLDPDLAGRMGRAGRQNAEEQTWEKVGERVDSLLARLIEGDAVAS